MMHRLFASLLLAAASIGLLSLAGCGEREQTAHYEQGRYRGKPDTPPHAGAPFNGDRMQYENHQRTRAQQQNEYNRIK
jgi:hypothetical protein